MGKVVIKAKKDGIEVTNLISYPETLSQQMQKTINAGTLHGLLAVESKEAGKKTELKCAVKNAIPLDVFFSFGVSKKVFFNILNQIVSVLQSCKENGFQTNTLVLEKKQMFWDQTTGRIRCIYWPVVNSTYRNNIGEFFYHFPQNISFSEKKHEPFLSEYYSFFGRDRSFSLASFSQMISNYSAEDTDVRSIRSIESSKTGQAQEKYRNAQTPEYNPFLHLQNASQPFTNCETPALIRAATGEVIDINRFPFVIGRIPECCNYALPDDPGISAQHLEITKMDSYYYICDLNSKNKTFLNNRMLQPNTHVVMENNAEIRITNETFRFVVQVHKSNG